MVDLTAQKRAQRRIGWALMALCAVVATTNLVNLLMMNAPNLLVDILLNVVLILAIGGVGMFVAWLNTPVTKMVLILLFLLPAGPATLGGNASFIGMWMVIIAVTLIVKLQPIPKFQNWFLGAALASYTPWVYLLVLRETGGVENIPRVINYVLFLVVGILTLYFLFEEEIRDLLATNKQKDEELAEKDAEIARLVPLSVLGERVAHVAHSFKNNLGLLSTAQIHLENGGDPAKAAQKLRDFSRSMDERIDNILMVSRAGADQAPEVFDAARVLAGLNQVYLTEPAFLQRAKIELTADEPTPVYAVRWDFLLLAENILTNALEALTAKGGYGTIRVTLKDRVLSLANDGGAIETCNDCHTDCLNCPKYGKPGRTTKSRGSGHGLAQVFSVCRKHGWTLRIRTQGDWTIFEIGLTKAEPPQTRD